MPPVPRELKTVADTALYLGIDPGEGGGLALVRTDTLGRAQPALVMKLEGMTHRELWDRLTSVAPRVAFALIEKVGGYAGEGEGEKGGGAANGSAMFKFGASYGMLRMALVAAAIPFEEVPPLAWQRGLGIPPRKRKAKGMVGEDRTAWKRRLREMAQRLFPGAVSSITGKTADALLIAEHCRRVRQAAPPLPASPAVQKKRGKVD